MAIASRMQAKAPATTTKAATARPAVAAVPAKKNGFASAAAATVLSAALVFGAAAPALADVSGLTPCASSKQFATRQKKEVKALQKRLKQYEDGTAPALALQATIDRTEKRFANYGKAGLLCGTDGLPHLIADPGLALRYGHAGETLIPTVGFLYIAGWIGYVGREYLGIVAKGAKPTEKEIIIDVPLALSLAWKGAGWPARAVAELRNGTLLEDDDNITVSPR